MLNGLGFTKDSSGAPCILVGQKYIDTYSRNSSLHHTMLIHEFKHFVDYQNNKSTFFNSKSKEKYWYEFAARTVEIDFIKFYLIGKYQLSKLEEFEMKSNEEDNLDNFTIVFQRISKNIYSIFRDFEIEYSKNILSIECLVQELANAAYLLFDQYKKSDNDYALYDGFVRIKSFRNCLEDISLKKK
jgi:hypothetical protein